MADERGAALITALIFLVLLTALGLAAINTSSTELLIARNYRLDKMALNSANAGMQAAMARMDMYGMSTGLEIGYNMRVTSLDATGFGDSTWAFNSEEMDISGVEFTGVVSYKKEDGDHYRDMLPLPATGADDDEVVAYSTDCGYSEAPLDDWQRAFPVYQIQSTGTVKNADGDLMATATVYADVTRNTLNVYADSGMWANGCVTINGAGNNMSGGGEVDVDGNPIPSLITGGTGCADQADMEAASGGAGNVTNGVSFDPDDFLGYSMEELKSFASVIPYTSGYNAPGMTFGDQASESPDIIYFDYQGAAVSEPPNDVDDDVTLNNCQGYGVLFVNGDLKIQGSFNWKGLIYVNGEVTLGGGGSEAKNIEGAIMSAGALDATIGGNLNVTYDSDILEEVSAAGFETKVVNWRRDYNF